MDIIHRIKIINEELDELRCQWKLASLPMKKLIEEKAKTKKSEITMLEKVLRRKRNLEPTQDSLFN